MKVSDNLTYIRWKANVDSNSPYDDTTLLPIWNMAKNRVAQAIAQVNPNYLAETSTTATVARQSLYTKPDDFLLFKRMDISYSNTNVGSFNPARLVSVTELGYGEDYYASYADTAYPLIREEGKYFNISPAPTSSTAGSLFLKLWYVPLPADLTDLTVTTDIYTLTGIGKPFHELIADIVVNEIKGKKQELTPLEVREQNQEVIDILVPAAFSQISTTNPRVPSDTYLQY